MLRFYFSTAKRSESWSRCLPWEEQCSIPFVNLYNATACVIKEMLYEVFGMTANAISRTKTHKKDMSSCTTYFRNDFLFGSDHTDTALTNVKILDIDKARLSGVTALFVKSRAYYTA